jgi:hypothetical protein
LEEVAVDSSNACFLIFYRGLAADLSAALTQAADLEQSMENWMLLHRRLMSFLRRGRSRAMLFNLDDALSDIEKMAASCRQLGVELSAATFDLPSSPSGALEQWIVQQWLAERPEAQVFESTLEAFAQPLGDNDKGVGKRSLDAVLEAYIGLIGQKNALEQQSKAAATQVAGLVSEKASAEKDNALLRSQIQQIQGDLESALSAKKQSDRAAEAASSEIADLKASEAEASAAKKEFGEENELLLLQLHQVQEELESIFLAKQQSEQAAEAVSNELAGLKASEAKALADKQALAEEHRSLVERFDQVQKQLETTASEKTRSEQAAEAGRAEVADLKASEAEALAEKKELAEENELLLLQLHQVQEELEAYFLENLRLQKMLPEESAQQSSDSDNSASVSEEVDEHSKTSAEPRRESLLDAYRYKRELKKYQRLVASSELFDAEWYLSVNDDVAKAGMDPAEHYVRYGAGEGRDPSPQFSTTSYLAINDDVAEAGMNPLVHYLLYGKDEGRALSQPRSVW